MLESHVALPIASYAKSGMRRATIEISKTVNVSLHFADRNNVQLTVANTESKPAAARIICNCPRLMFGRLMIEYSIWNDVFKQSVPNAASKRSCPLRTASSL